MKQGLNVSVLSDCEKTDISERNQNVRKVKSCKTVVRGEPDS